MVSKIDLIYIFLLFIEINKNINLSVVRKRCKVLLDYLIERYELV